MTAPMSTPGPRVVLVTGAGGGLGRAVAVAFASGGAHIVLAGRTRTSLDETAQLVQGAGGTAELLPLDVSDALGVASAIAALPRLDVAVNTAGTIASAPLAEMEAEAFDQVFHVNVRGLWLTMSHEVRRMRKSGGGVIINIGSNIGARVTRPGLGAYAASKAAVSSLTKTAALEELPNGVRINCICPGPIDTPMSYRAGEDRTARDARLASTNPSGRAATPSEIADAAVWLASERAAYIVGQEIVMDGGASV